MCITSLVCWFLWRWCVDWFVADFNSLCSLNMNSWTHNYKDMRQSIFTPRRFVRLNSPIMTIKRCQVCIQRTTNNHGSQSWLSARVDQTNRSTCKSCWCYLGGLLYVECCDCIRYKAKQANKNRLLYIYNDEMHFLRFSIQIAITYNQTWCFASSTNNNNTINM